MFSHREHAADDQRRVLFTVRLQLIDGFDSLSKIFRVQQRLHLFYVLTSVCQAVDGGFTDDELTAVSAEHMTAHVNIITTQI